MEAKEINKLLKSLIEIIIILIIFIITVFYIDSVNISSYRKYYFDILICITLGLIIIIILITYFHRVRSEVGNIQTIFVILYDCILNLRFYFPNQIINGRYQHRLDRIIPATTPNRDNLLKEKTGSLLEELILLNILIGLSLIGLNSEFNIPQWILNCFIIYAFVRIADIIIYQLYAIKVSTPNTVTSPSRIVFLIFLNYFEIIIWFAFFYQILGKIDSSLSDLSHSISNSLYFSLSNIALLGVSSIDPQNAITKFFISVEILLGLFIIVITIARFIPLLEPKNRPIGTEQTTEQIEDYKYFNFDWILIYILIWYDIFIIVNIMLIQHLYRILFFVSI